MEPKDKRPGRWPEMARVWKQIWPPLRPSGEDIDVCRRAVEQWRSDALARQRAGGSHPSAGQDNVPKPAPRVLLLGVTPEIYHMPWPEGTDFLAVDRTQAMIETVWPGPKDRVLQSDWLDMRLPAASRDVVLCDGGLHLLAYPHDQKRLVELLAGILSDGGILILRLFAPPARRESSSAVLADLLSGNIPNLNILKLRLWMALLRNPAEGVELGAVWNAVHDVAPDMESAASRIGWSSEHFRAIDAYRGAKARYCFVTVDEAQEMFCASPGGFTIQQLSVPAYPLGEQCPTLVLRRKER